MKQIQRTGFHCIYCITQIKSTFNSKLWIKSIFISKDKRILQTLGFNSSLHCNIFHRIAQYCTDHFVKAVWLWRTLLYSRCYLGPTPALLYSPHLYLYMVFHLDLLCVTLCLSTDFQILVKKFIFGSKAFFGSWSIAWDCGALELLPCLCFLSCPRCILHTIPGILLYPTAYYPHQTAYHVAYFLSCPRCILDSYSCILNINNLHLFCFVLLPMS